jgi:hypothetical protein
MSWRTVSALLAVLLAWQTWRGCTRVAPRPPAPPAPAASAEAHRSAPCDDGADPAARPGGSSAVTQSAGGFDIYGFRIQVPGWAWSLLPQSGEDLRKYRDRMLPLARAALAPHRARVARSRDDLARELGLDARQREVLDAATRETAQAIQDRLFTAALGGELAPAAFKPMTAISLAREVLSLVDTANQRFVGALGQGQRDQLARHPFDFADYLLFSTPWEDAISGL